MTSGLAPAIASLMPHAAAAPSAAAPHNRATSSAGTPVAPMRAFSQVCGVAGLCLAVFMSLVLVERRGLSPWILAAIAVAAVSTFLSLAMLTKIVTGAETLVYYHHEIAVISVAAVLLSVLHRPVLPRSEEHT